MQKFFTDTIESSFIKELVYSCNIPSYDSISDGDYAFSGVVYIYKNKIIKVITSGTIGVNATYREIKSYAFNEKIDKVTENYISKYRYYDSDTHYQLGRYLRLLRDCTGVDLMPFYNCYSAKTVSDVFLGNKDEVLFVGDDNLTTNTKDYKIALVPIRFNKKYTICVDSHSGIRMKPIFYGNFGIVRNTPFPSGSETYFGNTEVDEESTSFKKPFTYELDMNAVTFRDSVFVKATTVEGGSQIILENPVALNGYIDIKSQDGSITYEGTVDGPDRRKITFSNNIGGITLSVRYDACLNDNDKTKMMSYEKYLYLLMQLPITNKSSIVVQEGDYTLPTESRNVGGNCPTDMNKVYDEVGMLKLTDNQLNSLFISDLQLQRISTGESYPYSKRLIEYLLDNVITSNDLFGGDIERVQDVLGKSGVSNTGKRGVWNREIRSELFKRYIGKSEKYRQGRSISDINGFVDKDVEDYLNKVDKE